MDAILEGAARILEERGFEGYTTNDIAARAGVSIGSLYQYFPTRDAVTVALIERESAKLAADVKRALGVSTWIEALRGMIESAVRHQLQRPQLTNLLEFEDDRLSRELPRSSSAASVHIAIVSFLKRKPGEPIERPQWVATDLMAITRALTDAAGRRKTVDAVRLRHAIERALLGYLCCAAPEDLR